MSADYFDPYGKVLRIAFWATTTQTQMERWEPLLAENLAKAIQPAMPEVPIDIIWRINAERHFMLVAADHLITALKFAQFPVQFPVAIATEIAAGRDLNEHWKENMPIFNTNPRTGVPPKNSGKAFAASNPRSGPYSGWNWDSTVGPHLLPKVPASLLHDIVERVKARAVSDHPNLGDFLHAWDPSPWIGGDDPGNRWFPRSLLVE